MHIGIFNTPPNFVASITFFLSCRLEVTSARLASSLYINIVYYYRDWHHPIGSVLKILFFYWCMALRPKYAELNLWGVLNVLTFGCQDEWEFKKKNWRLVKRSAHLWSRSHVVNNDSIMIYASVAKTSVHYRGRLAFLPAASDFKGAQN